jgi:hypothetical protein
MKREAGKLKRFNRVFVKIYYNRKKAHTTLGYRKS